jgi:integrase
MFPYSLCQKILAQF